MFPIQKLTVLSTSSIATLAALALGIGVVPLAAAPKAGTLVHASAEMIKYQCHDIGPDRVACRFDKVAFERPIPPEEVFNHFTEFEASIPDEATFKEWFGDAAGTPFAAACANLDRVDTYFGQIATGNLTAASALHDELAPVLRDMLGAFGLSQSFQSHVAARYFERGEIVDALDLHRRMCAAPSRDTLMRFAYAASERDAMACKLHTDRFEATFTRRGDTAWLVDTNGPEGACGIEYLDRFECAADGSECQFIFETNMLSPDATKRSGQPCRSVELETKLFFPQRERSFVHCTSVEW